MTIIKFLLISLIIGSTFVYSQDCNTGYTYHSTLPDNVNNINNDNNCFYDDDLNVLSDLIVLNDLDYTSPLEIGPQTWVSGRLVSWVVTFTPNGVNGVNQQLTQLPENVGNLTNLSSLYLEWNILTQIPTSFSELTNLTNFAISNNYLTSLPNDFGELTSLVFLDLGYNQLTSIPESIGNLLNLEYLWLFNNQLSSVPESICDIPLTWSGADANNYPNFAIGGNELCDSELIPCCIEVSDNFTISLDQFYYSFLVEVPQSCLDGSYYFGKELGDLNGDGGFNVLDIVTLANCVLAVNCADLEYGCAGDVNGDGNYNVLDIVTLANCVLAGNCGG